jgi:hypothetical protein
LKVVPCGGNWKFSRFAMPSKFVRSGGGGGDVEIGGGGGGGGGKGLAGLKELCVVVSGVEVLSVPLLLLFESVISPKVVWSVVVAAQLVALVLAPSAIVVLSIVMVLFVGKAAVGVTLYGIVAVDDAD